MEAAASMETTMKHLSFALFMAFLLASTDSFAAKPKLAVTVINNIPTAFSYEWVVAGRSSVSCYSSGCTSYYAPARSGTRQVNGATLKLLLSDGRIVIASCYANTGNLAFGLIGAMTGDSYLNAPRNCSVPEADETIQADFRGSFVRLFWRQPSIDGTGRKSNEMYSIRGVLNPERVQ